MRPDFLIVRLSNSLVHFSLRDHYYILLRLREMNACNQVSFGDAGGVPSNRRKGGRLMVCWVTYARRDNFTLQVAVKEILNSSINPGQWSLRKRALSLLTAFLAAILEISRRNLLRPGRICLVFFLNADSEK